MKEGEEAFLHHARLCRMYGAAVVVMAFDEQGQADTEARKVEICTRAYQLLTEEVGFPPEDIVFDPNIFAVATGIEEHDNYGVDFIEATRRDHRDPAARPHLGRRLQPLLLLPRQRAGARGDARGVPLPRHPAPAWTWASSTPASSPSTTRSSRSCARPARTSCSTARRRRRHATERLLELAERFKGTAGKEAQGARPRLARMAGREAARACAGQRHHRVHRRRHRGGAARRRAAAARHRRPADGGMNVVGDLFGVGQDVPAAGGEVGARDEAGGRRAPALHGGGEARERRRRRAPERRQDPDGDRQGRRPRHRQEHRRRRARLQQLRDHRPRRHGAGDEDPGDRARPRRSTSSASPA